jgi:DnaJ-class molecular chaperone
MAENTTPTQLELDEEVLLELMHRQRERRKLIVVRAKCPRCWGAGEVDTAHHGSAEWETCTTCKGVKSILRSLTNEEAAALAKELNQ